MGENSAIQWTDHTGGPWLICTEVSPGCANCYARELMLTRLAPLVRKAYKAKGFSDWESRPIWGKLAPRVLTKGFWEDAKRLNAKAAKAGTRYKMFPSMIDWLDEMPAGIINQEGEWLDAVEVLADFLKLIYDTPNLDWLLLTKRPGNWASSLETADAVLKNESVWHWRYEDVPPDNIWLGTSVEDQQRANERIPQLLNIPARIRFLSVEPMLGPIQFTKPYCFNSGIHWVIFGGESGSGARPCNVEWIRDGNRQCREAGVKVFNKQLGARPFGRTREDADVVALRDKKGGDMAEWPEDLRIREFPGAPGQAEPQRRSGTNDGGPI